MPPKIIDGLTTSQRYRKSEKGKKTCKIKSWKQRGLISDNYDYVYDRYMNTINCDICNSIFEPRVNWKCMDHNHITGEFRNILCNRCNIRRFDIKRVVNIHFCKSRNSWKYERTYNFIKYQKSNVNKIKILCYKFIFDLKIKSGLLD